MYVVNNLYCLVLQRRGGVWCGVVLLRGLFGIAG
jgi:hypothetical protein